VPGSSSQGIFLSYRREDAAPYARLLKSELREHIPDVQVFMDLDSIEAGLDFAEVIRAAVDSCAILVALIGRQWATLADDGGNRRLDNPDDLVRFEVQTALDRGVRVIPVLVDGAAPLRQQQLPDPLQKLARLNAFELSYGRYEYDATRLLDLIERALAAASDVAADGTSPPSTDPADLEHGGQEFFAPARSAPPASPTVAAPQTVRGDSKALQAAGRIAQGVSSVTELIARTLGPVGRISVLQDQAGNDIEASDARTIAEHFVPEDPREALGVTYVREMVREQHQDAHDGAATAAVLADAMTARAMEGLRAGANPMSLKRGIETAAERVRVELLTIAKDVEYKEQLASLAQTCTADASIGQVIAEAWDKVGKEGAITVEESNTFGLELELTEGMRFDKGYIAPYFVTDPERREAVLDDPYILVVDSKISANNDVLPVLDRVVQSGKSLLVIAEDVEGEVLATLVLNKMRDLFKSVAVKAPGFGDRRKAMLGDIAILTGGQVISKEVGVKLADVDLNRLGRARKVVVTKDETTIIDGAGDADQIRRRVNQLRTDIDNTDSDYDREKLQERLAKLAGGVAVIKIGAADETALQQRKQLAESAISITREAIAQGLLPGGGSALVEVQHRLGANDGHSAGIPSRTPDEATGVAIVFGSLAEPLKRIMANAGYDPPGLADSISAWEAGTGFDVMTNKQTDMLAAGIIDSCAVVSQSVANAINLTQRLLLVV
jgi:chaperonin GroEL